MSAVTIRWRARGEDREAQIALPQTWLNWANRNVESEGRAILSIARLIAHWNAVGDYTTPADSEAELERLRERLCELNARHGGNE